MVKSPGYSFREPGFDSQHSQSDSELPITSVPGHLIPCSRLCGQQVYPGCTDKHSGKTSIRIKLKKAKNP